LKHSARAIRVVTTLAVLVVVVASFPAVGGAANETPKATEVGIDGQTIHIATVADVDNPIAPGLMAGGVDGVRGAVALINKQGGIGGRKVVMDFIDSHLNPNETRNAFIAACGQDYALVGTGAFLVTNIDDIVGCKDQAGQTTGLPDIPAVTSGYLDSCGSVIYPLNGSQIDCSTQSQKPQRFTGLAGDSKYLNKKYGPLHGTLIVSSDSKSTQQSSTVLGLFAQKAGIKIDHTVPMTSRATQIQYTPVIQQIKQGGDNYNLSGTPADNVIEMRQEAQLQGFTDPKFTWTCLLNCYDKKLVDAGSVVDGTRVSMTYLPFEEAKYNKTLKNFVKYVGADKINGFAMWGFASTLLFAQVAKQVVKDHGVNGLTRANLLTALKNTHSFNGAGMYGTVDPGNKLSSSCFMILDLKGGKYVREYPTKPGTMDCKPSNRISIEADVLGQ
jgi:ABC-type branched-subunit amino acid transport system substrate-binding protein